MLPQAEITALGWQGDLLPRNRLISELTRERRALLAELDVLRGRDRSAGAVPQDSPLRQHAQVTP